MREKLNNTTKQYEKELQNQKQVFELNMKQVLTELENKHLKEKVSFMETIVLLTKQLEDTKNTNQKDRV